MAEVLDEMVEVQGEMAEVRDEKPAEVAGSYPG